MIDMLRRHPFSLAFVAALFGFFYLSSSDDRKIEQFSGLTMGTSYQLQLAHIPPQLSLSEIEIVVTELLFKMDKLIFSTYAEDSELSRLNRHPLDLPMSVSDDLFAVLEMAQAISAQTGGAFDVTIGPLVNLWGFGSDYSVLPQVPAQELIAAAKSRVGFANIELNKSTLEVTKRKPVTIDLSAIAKGYAVDQLAAYFDRQGSTSYFLEVGGELIMKGFKPGGSSWVPAIEAPLNTDSQIYEVFFSRGQQIAVAGSGDYRNYFEQDGVRYSHEIDPRTGYPVTHTLAAAYVIDESTAIADALATSYMILGYDEARRLAESTNQAAYFIYKQEGGFADYATPSFAEYLER
ncbi:MAG: thiamine biosynthesis lipoprotein [Pseudohongiellaceae bacterium]|jgi:thiamine biosynthesis lipoprotein